MKYLDFEKHIKKEFANSKEPVQMDALLASLDLGKETKRKGFAFWMIIPFLILTFSVFAWKFSDSYNHKVEDPNLSEEVSSPDIIDNEVYSDLNPKGDQTENAVGQLIDESSEVEGETNNTKTNSSNANQSNTNTENTTTENTTIEKSTKNIKTNSKTILNSTRPPANTSQPIYKPQNTNFIPLGNDVNEAIDDMPTNQSRKSSASLNSGYIGNPSASVSASQTRSLLSINDLGMSIDKLGDTDIDGKLFSRMKINCPSFENPGWHMALIPEVGIFMPRKTLALNSLEESASFNKRQESETTLEGIELGLYGMVVRDNVPFYLKAGLSYSRITERMDLEYEGVRQDTMQGIIAKTISGNGDTITYVKGDIVTQTKFKGSNRQHHYIHLFDVPISIGFTTYVAGLDVGIEGGVKVNFMTRATGNLLVSDTEYINLSLNRLFKNRIGLSYFGGLMIGRNFGRFGDIYIAPRFTYFPNEFNNQNNNVSQKYFAVGLNAGVVYKIN